jgi:hypothetical protein
MESDWRVENAARYRSRLANQWREYWAGHQKDEDAWVLVARAGLIAMRGFAPDLLAGNRATEESLAAWLRAQQG